MPFGATSRERNPLPFVGSLASKGATEKGQGTGQRGTSIRCCSWLSFRKNGDDLPETRRFDRGVRDPWCTGAIRRARVGSALLSMALPGPLLDLQTPDGSTWHPLPLCRWAPEQESTSFS